MNVPYQTNSKRIAQVRSDRHRVFPPVKVEWKSHPARVEQTLAHVSQVSYGLRLVNAVQYDPREKNVNVDSKRFKTSAFRRIPTSRYLLGR